MNNLEEELYKLGASEGKTRAQFFLERQKEFERLSRYQTRVQRLAMQDQKKLEELQQARKAKETQDFQDAAGLLYQAAMIDKNYDPIEFAKFGFVWSPEQILEYAELHAVKKGSPKERTLQRTNPRRSPSISLFSSRLAKPRESVHPNYAQKKLTADS